MACRDPVQAGSRQEALTHTGQVSRVQVLASTLKQPQYLSVAVPFKAAVEVVQPLFPKESSAHSSSLWLEAQSSRRDGH